MPERDMPERDLPEQHMPERAFDRAVLSVDEMYRADAAAAAAGVAGLALMEAAGGAIARAIRQRWRPQPTLVLCGPGNNGGDGFVVARLLAGDGWPVRLALLGDRAALRGDAAVNAARWTGRVLPLDPFDPAMLARDPLVVDALFGAGLARPLQGAAAAAIAALNRRGLDCVAVDVPSGVHGDSGGVLGTADAEAAAPRCRLTVTFFRPKPAHLLLPGRLLCGELVVADIGIPAAVLEPIGPRTFENDPRLWQACLPQPDPAGNKYGRGHAVISAGAEMSGAARLAAEAARRTGAGLVTVAAPPSARDVIAGEAPGTIVSTVADEDAFQALLQDPRRNAVLIGPGAGVSPATRERVLLACALRKACVLDADALSVFQGDAEALFAAIGGAGATMPCVLTPHDGEFARLFDTSGDKLARSRRAAVVSGAVVLLKGADTVVAAPDGRAAINSGAPPDLATAGSGDVLAGIILGLLAQRMPPFEAACAAAWMHARSASAFGPGLIAEDLIDGLPAVIRWLRAAGSRQQPCTGGLPIRSSKQRDGGS